MAHASDKRSSAGQDRVKAVLRKIRLLHCCHGTSLVTLVKLMDCLDLADRINHTLQSRREITKAVNNELSVSFSNDLPLLRPSHLYEHRRQAEDLGCALWNAAIRADQEVGAPSSDNRTQAERFIVLLRSFAFTLLHLAYPVDSAGTQSEHKTTRNLKIGLRAAKQALDLKEHDVSLRVLELCSVYVKHDDFQDTPILYRTHEMEDRGSQSKREMYIVYYLLRIQYAITINHMDMAEHFFSKFQLGPTGINAVFREQAAQLFYTCGNDLFNAGQYITAIIWLQRALETINASEDHGSSQCREIRLASTARIVAILLKSSTQESLTQAWDLANDLDRLYELTNDINAIAIQVDVLLATEPIRRDLVKDALFRSIRCQISTDSFAIFMKIIHRVKVCDISCAEFALEAMITGRLLSNPANELHEQWLENCLVTFILLLLDPQHNNTAAATASRLSTLMDSIQSCTSVPLTAKAVCAIQTLIWKRLNEEDVPTAVPWLGPLRHGLLTLQGEVNHLCIQRKTVQLYLANEQIVEARAVFYEMKEQYQDEPLSRYLGFKIALQQQDYDLAAECLRIISKAEDATSLLHACAIEAQTSASKALTLSALEALASTTADEIISPTLLRCLARLQISLVEPSDDVSNKLESVTATFDRCVRIIQSKSWNQEQLTAESAWWSKTAYNLALQWSQLGVADPVVRLLKVCTILGSIPAKDETTEDQHKRAEKVLISHFLIATALIVLARNHPDQSTESLQCYAEARPHIQEYLTCWEAAKTSGNPTLLAAQRAFELLRFDLEALCKLKQWQDLDIALNKCLDFPEAPHWQKLADIVLIIHKELGSTADQSAYTPKILDILQHIVNDTWRKDKNVVQAARWVRVAFSIDGAALDKGQSDGKVAFKLMSQAAEIAKRGHHRDSARYPDDELQWLSSVAFNRGIDACIAVQRELAWKWFHAALELARYAADNGRLHACLQERQAEAERYLDKVGR